MKRIINEKHACKHGIEWRMVRIIDTRSGPQAVGFTLFITHQDLLYSGRRIFAARLRKARRIVAAEIQSISLKSKGIK